MAGWKGSTRKASLPRNWASEIRPRILRRDRERCQWIRNDTDERCGARANQVDHVNQERNWDHSDGNLQSLCEYHHNIKSSGEGGRAAAERRKAATRLHPGVRR
ncbi:5-methylcytosine-specific restriction protein A [Microbacterium testaceum]|uniref:HNH endonuclease n=1 Tax=Microbacterium TaxID=33882 RepID=UPI002788B0A4|nr:MULTISPECIES: hypothetical protein [Microbacterium]MDQ1113956.1 5-methylcytosine-specific restriction protein A [Microbacterium testaceum]MDR6098938.1 5-methylcytosine-specific restriction protein A [Microbacterium sp. SORGH_AS_0454]